MDNQKHLFQLYENVHYLNCAYKSPLLRSAEIAATDALKFARNPSDISSSDFFEEGKEARSLFGKLINCDAENVAIVPSTSYAFSSVLKNVKPKEKGHAITIQDEFPSGYFSLENWCKKNDNAFLVIGPDKDAIQIGQSWHDNILNAINESTSVVLMSSVHWMEGVAFDLKQIGARCKEVGAVFIIDGSQSVGALPIDVKACNIDALVSVTYKWLFGAYSVALAYISDKFAKGAPLEESWMNRSNAEDFTSLTNYDHNYMPHAGRYNVGQKSNLVLMPMVIEGLKQVLEWTPAGIQSYCKELMAPLKSCLDKYGIACEEDQYFANHLVAIKLPSSFDTVRFKRLLADSKIVVSNRGTIIRVSFNVYNDAEDVAKLIDVIETLSTNT